MDFSLFKDKTVLVTGHTGFKGAWLTQWLLQLGARVLGYARDPQYDNSLFEQLQLSGQMLQDVRADLLEQQKLEDLINKQKPEFVFHLAAQPLVRYSYEQPLETFHTNVIGTMNVLESIRRADYACTVIVVTTDKCYRNNEWLYAYREVDALGGHDPYSASKACSELVAQCYNSSYFKPQGKVRMATVRAGNVIGGGDYAADRIVPDCWRAVQSAQSIAVRNKTATRPWQHVLEPLSGYLLLAKALHAPQDFPQASLEQLQESFNFGPNITSNRTVKDLVVELLKHLEGTWHDASDPNAVHEASKLNLSIDKAFHLLGWQPCWDFERTIKETAEWYRNTSGMHDAAAYTKQQISQYSSECLY